MLFPAIFYFQNGANQEIGTEQTNLIYPLPYRRHSLLRQWPAQTQGF